MVSIDSIYERARKGQPLDDVCIIDSHSHIGSYHAFNAPHSDAEGMLESMDALGVDRVMITAHASIGPDFVYGNNLVIAALQKYPDRFWGYATLNPHYPGDLLSELDRCFAVPGMMGIKLHPSCHEVAIEHENYRPVYEYANQNHCPVLIHTWGVGQIQAIGRLAGQYPDIPFLIGHFGGDIAGMEESIRIINQHTHVYGDLALSIVREGNVEWLVENVGSGKVLYASDMPFFDPRSAFGRVALSKLTYEQKLDVFGLNMKRILGL
ncbi:MAG TPA: hypothetical protein DD640_05110 [Clostridiales bacterium]|nr:hypothetical protein [Clostridiales bacterium]